MPARRGRGSAADGDTAIRDWAHALVARARADGITVKLRSPTLAAMTACDTEPLRGAWWAHGKDSNGRALRIRALVGVLVVGIRVTR